MANHGAKKRLEDNQRVMKNLRLAILIGLLCYGGLRLGYLKAYRSGWHWAGFVVTSLVNFVSYSLLSSLASPIFSANGELEYGGAEIGKPGSMSSYYFDLLYVSVFVQVAGALWTPFWWTYLAVPGYALYMLFKKVIMPWVQQPDQAPVMDEATRKKFERAEARAERRKMKWR